jgi:hypothetical protein
MYIGELPLSYIYNITKSREWNQISKDRGDLSGAPENEKKGDFPMRMDEKTLGKNRHVFMGASENEIISVLSSSENFLNIPWSVICQNKWVE